MRKRVSRVSLRFASVTFCVEFPRHLSCSVQSNFMAHYGNSFVVPLVCRKDAPGAGVGAVLGPEKDRA